MPAYASLEEVWGKNYDSENKNSNLNNNNNNYNNNTTEPVDSKRRESSNDKILNRDLEQDLDLTNKLNTKSNSDRNNIINSMNNVERNSKTENGNSSVDEYNRYRINPYNKVKENENLNLLDTNKNESENCIFNSIEKKFLQDKLNFLEQQLKLHQDYDSNHSRFDNSNNYSSSNDSSNFIENFQNSDNSLINTNRNADIIDLIVLIIIGLIIIFIMNSIFNLGKSIGIKAGSRGSQ
jgi:hypothetical protein